MEPPGQFSAIDILGVSVTVAGFALVLATLQPSGAAPVFLTAGLFATGGSLYAVASLWDGSGARVRQLVDRENRPEGLREYRLEALVATSLGLLLLTGAYLKLLFDIYF